MTIQQAITYLDTVKPNAFPEDLKLAWLSEIEGKIALQIHLLDPEELADLLPYSQEDMGAELRVGVPYTGLYTWWLQAQADMANAEYDLAQNSMAMFNAAWAEYLRWYCQRYDPVEGAEAYEQHH